MKKFIPTQEQIEQFQTLAEQYPLHKVSELMGIKLATIRIRIMKPLGWVRDESKRREFITNNEAIETIKRMALTHTQREIAKELQTTINAVKHYYKKLGIKVTPEIHKQNTSKGYKELVQKEKRRMLFGFPQQTDINLKLDSKLAVKKQKMRTMFRHYGYHVPTASNVIYFSSDIKRHPKLESNAQKLGFMVNPLRNIIQK